MRLVSGYFSEPESHHPGWLRLFRGHGIAELWLGHRWILLEWRR